MRYLPLDASERDDDAPRGSAFADIDDAVRRHPGATSGRGLLDMPRAMSEIEVERRWLRWPRQQSRRRVGAVLSRRRRLQASHSRDRRSSDPALGIPHQLHALSAGDLAGHAAGPVRVPDPGGGAHRHGGRQRLDVRRLDRLRRGDADGASPDQAAQGGAFRAGCIRNMPTSRRPWRIWRATRSCGSRRTSARSEDIAAAIDGETTCVIVQSPDFFGNLRDLRADRGRRARQGRAADRGLHRGGRRSAPLRSPGAMGADIVVGEGQSSATRSISAAPMSGCSRRV